MIKRIIKSILQSRGFTINLYNQDVEKLNKVKYDWLKNINITSVIDIGASTGGFAKKIRTILPNATIHSFEPLISSYQVLLNALPNDDKFYAYHIAMGDKKGKAKFYENDYSGSSSLLKMTHLHKEAYPQTKNETEIEVDIDTLDNLFFDFSKFNGRILLKMDVQGAEGKVLEGACRLLDSVDIVFTEVSFTELYEKSIQFNEISKVLEKKGFVVFGFENVSQSLINGIFLQADAFFVKKQLIKEIVNGK